MKVLRVIATEVGRGLIAGFVGAVAMTIASTLEMKLRKRPASSAPADAAGKVLGIEPSGRKGQAALLEPRPLRVRQRVGTRARGDPGGVLRRRRAGARRSRSRSRTSPLVWGVGLAMLPALGITKPFWRWGTKEIAIDALHHTVYAAAADGAYRLLGEPSDAVHADALAARGGHGGDHRLAHGAGPGAGGAAQRPVRLARARACT